MIISTENAPKAIGPYSQARKVGNSVYISGCCPFHHEDGSVVGADITTQTNQVMKNLKAVVEAAGYSMDDVVKTTCFISDMNNFITFNGVYQSYFSEGIYPARSCVEVSRLPKDVLIEVEAIVLKQ
ncbi:MULTISPECIES: RidA family protein [Providencia]|uniref:RidA family protein n=1 Tax=Providencia TaxID=586 RepID=UPI000F78C693|nr:RidA family protein [Providencia rettgeri]MBV2188884.1 RidA family protein [Providencia rettgeri]HEC8325112.1 RidA family protein [Providencia rettgeri]